MKKIVSLSIVLCILIINLVAIPISQASENLLGYSEAIQHLNNVSLSDFNELELISKSLEAVGSRYYAPQYRIIADALRDLARDEISEETLNLIETSLTMVASNNAFVLEYQSNESLSFLPIDTLLMYVAARRFEAQGYKNEAIEAYTQAQILDSLRRGIKLQLSKNNEESVAGDQQIDPQKSKSYLSFGRYEQDNDPNNGAEVIIWRILKTDGENALIVSEYNLDCIPYNDKSDSIDWKASTIREWLNSSFLNSAFSTEERKVIQESTLEDESDSSGMNITHDMVFILSQGEVEDSFIDQIDRIAFNTSYATARGASRDESSTGWWWLRLSNNPDETASGVNRDGSFDPRDKKERYGDESVRPAMWIDLNILQTIDRLGEKNDSNADASLLGLSKFEAGTYSFALEKIDWDKIVVNDPANELQKDTKVFRNPILNPVKLSISMSVTGSNDVMMLFMSDNDDRLHWTREDVASGGTAQIVVNISDEDIKAVGDQMWMLKFTNFDAQNDATVVVEIEKQEEEASNGYGNVVNGNFATIYDDVLYYENGNDFYNIYSSDANGDNPKLLYYVSGYPNSGLFVVDGSIYHEDVNKLIRTSVNGESSVILLDDMKMTGYYGSLLVHQNRVYVESNPYNEDNSSKNNVYSIGIDGSDFRYLPDVSAWEISAYDEHLYYIEVFTKKVCRVNLDGSNRKILYEGESSSLNILKDWVFFSSKGSVMKMRHDGSELQEVIKNDVSNFNISNSRIYYISSRENLMSIRSADLQGEEDVEIKVIEDHYVDELTIAGDWLYMYPSKQKEDYYEIQGLFKLSRDGMDFMRVLPNNDPSYN